MLYVGVFSGGIYHDKIRPKSVFVSTAGSLDVSSDEPNCLLQPLKVNCSTLNYVLTKITSKELNWIDTVHLHEITSTENEIVLLPRHSFVLSKGINIVCLRSCVLTQNWTILVERFQDHFVLQIENIVFQNSIFTLANVHIVFKSIQFANSIIVDSAHSHSTFDQVELHFMGTIFSGHKSGATAKYGLFLGNVYSASIFMNSSEWYNVSTELSVPNLLFDSFETTFRDSKFSFRKHTFTSSLFQNNIFSGSHEDNTVFIFNIMGQKLAVHLVNCTFENTGLNVAKEDSGLLDSWIQVDIQNSTFHISKHWGSVPGAVSVSYIFLKKSTSLPNYVRIQNSLFHNGAVRIIALPSNSETPIINSHKTGEGCPFLSIHMENNQFNSRGTNDGHALFVSDKCLKLGIYNSSFELTDPLLDSPRSVFVVSNSDTAVGVAVMSSELVEQVQLITVDIILEMAEVKDLSISVQCHLWYKLSLTSTFSQGAAKGVQIICKSCTKSFYALSDGKFHVNMLPTQTSLFVNGGSTGELTCLPCPSGALCLGNDIIAIPNFWGYRTDDAIRMYQCPADYCCTANCTRYNQCSGHRTGMLCGSCEENYSLSMLSSQCIPQNLCNDHWLWPMAIFAIVLYMVWYTFKNDVFAIPISVAGVIYKGFSRQSADSDLNYNDKGYFGIVTFFTQIKALMVVHIPHM